MSYIVHRTSLVWVLHLIKTVRTTLGDMTKDYFPSPHVRRTISVRWYNVRRIMMVRGTICDVQCTTYNNSTSYNVRRTMTVHYTVYDLQLWYIDRTLYDVRRTVCHVQ